MLLCTVASWREDSQRLPMRAEGSRKDAKWAERQMPAVSLSLSVPPCLRENLLRHHVPLAMGAGETGRSCTEFTQLPGCFPRRTELLLCTVASWREDSQRLPMRAEGSRKDAKWAERQMPAVSLSLSVPPCLRENLLRHHVPLAMRSGGDRKIVHRIHSAARLLPEVEFLFSNHRHSRWINFSSPGV